MSTPAKFLPDSWVERIWFTMRANYGAAFDRQWACPAGEDPVLHVTAVKAHWSRELGGFVDKPDAIRYALDNPPNLPPTLPEFRALCNRAPEKCKPMLPAPKPDPEKMREALAGLNFQRTQSGPKSWAWRLKAREEAGDRLGAYQRSAWRAAVAADLGAQE